MKRTKGNVANLKYAVKVPRKVGRRNSPEKLQERLAQGKPNRKLRRALKLQREAMDMILRDIFSNGGPMRPASTKGRVN